MSAIDPRKLRIRFLTALFLGPLCLYIVYIGGFSFMVLVGLCLGLALWEGFLISKHIRPILVSLPIISLYSIVCFSAFAYVAHQNSLYTVAFIILVASSDVGAFFAGKYIGGYKLLPSVSPNKTWAGLTGGCLLPTIFCLAWFSPFLHSYEVLILKSLIVGVVIGVSGQSGDLLMSYFKRKADLKDAGALLPGHGGILDRFDGLMFCSLTYAMYLLML